jgi:hypothetical protein
VNIRQYFQAPATHHITLSSTLPLQELLFLLLLVYLLYLTSFFISQHLVQHTNSSFSHFPSCTPSKLFLQPFAVLHITSHSFPVVSYLVQQITFFSYLLSYAHPITYFFSSFPSYTTLRTFLKCFRASK